VATVVIDGAPVSAAQMLGHMPFIGERFAPPITPARLVALSDVAAAYQRTKSGMTALVITGAAENVGTRPLRAVQIAATLRGSGRGIPASRAVYCGNNLSARMVGEMTAHEIEFFQKLDAPKTFALNPSAACSFVIVFIDPPPSANHFEISVARAIAAAAGAERTSGA
jgi:hypothetical protein